MNHEDLHSALRAAVDAEGGALFPRLVKEHHAADIVSALDDFELMDVVRLLRQLPHASRAELFGYFPAERELALVECLSRRDLVNLFVHMEGDERVDLYNRLSEAQREQLLPALAQAEREDIRRLASYEEGTAGALMTSDYAMLTPELTARQAIERLRQIAPDAETIYQSYVVDEERRLLATVSLRELILAPAHARVAQIMRKEPIFIRAEAPQEEAAQQISKYDLLALPVVNGGDKLVGIITYDDALDAAQEEATEDFQKGGGSLSMKGLNLLEASPLQLYRKRIFWLLVLVFGNLLSGAGIAVFEETIATYIALVFFLPLLIGSGGNAGSQASTLMVRAMATGDVRMRDWGRMLGREFLVAALMGVTLALAASGIGWFRGGTEIALVVALAMLIIVVVGSLIGMSLPFLLSTLRLDPATASAPLVTTIADAAGVVIYLSIAVVVLGAPPA